MVRIRRGVVRAAAVLTLVLAGPAAASHGGLEGLISDYRADGRIDACDYSLRELEAARAEVPADIVEYAPDFVAELDRAIAARPACDPPAAPVDPVPPVVAGEPAAQDPAGKAKPKSKGKGKAKAVPASCRRLAGKKRTRCVKVARARARCKAMDSGKRRAACLKQAKRKARG